MPGHKATGQRGGQPPDPWPLFRWGCVKAGLGPTGLPDASETHGTFECPMVASKSQVFKCSLIIVVAFVCYGNTIANDYAYDDSVVITENQFTQQGIAGIPAIFKNDTFAGSYEGVPFIGRYRPLSLATFALEHELFGHSPRVSHFNNVLLFALTALVLYLLLSKIFRNRGGAGDCPDFPLIAVLLFVVHPIHTEVVANIKGRDEILVLAGASLATLFILKYLDGRRFPHLALAFCFFWLALFAKENAIVYLAAVPLTMAFYKRQTWTAWSVAPLIVASVVFLGVRALVLKGSGHLPPPDIITEPFAYANSQQKLATIVYTFGLYAKLLVFPHPLTIDYYPFHIKLMDWGSVGVWLSLLTYVAVTLLALRGARRRSPASYGVLFYLVSFSVVSNLPFSVGTFMSERFMFVPSVGFAVAVAWLLSRAEFLSIKQRNLIVLAVLVPCACKTYVRNEVWRDDLTLFTTDVKTSEDSIKANLVASVTLLAESHKNSVGATGGAAYRADALRYAKKAVSLYQQYVAPTNLKGSSYASAVMLLGNCYAENDMLDDALRCYEGIVGSTVSAETLGNLVETAINRSSEVDFKIRGYAEFVKLLPDNFSLNYHLALLYGKERNDVGMAVLYFNKAVDLAPNEVNALKGLSYAYKLSGDYEKASLYFERLVRLSPATPALLSHLRDLYGLAGNGSKEAEVTRQLEALAGGQEQP